MTPKQIAFNRRWIEALRSGKYSIARGIHKVSDTCYCALGLGYSLCPNPRWSPYGEHGWNASECGVAPEELALASGLDRNALLNIVYEYNDTPNGTFDQVADHLETLLSAEIQ